MWKWARSPFSLCFCRAKFLGVDKKLTHWPFLKSTSWSRRGSDRQRLSRRRWCTAFCCRLRTMVMCGAARMHRVRPTKMHFSSFHCSPNKLRHTGVDSRYIEHATMFCFLLVYFQPGRERLLYVCNNLKIFTNYNEILDIFRQRKSNYWVAFYVQWTSKKCVSVWNSQNMK